MTTETKAIELLEAIELLRGAGWTIEPPANQRATRAGKRVGRPPSKRGKKAKRVGRPPKKRVGRPPKNGRRGPGRPRKQETV